MSLIDLHDSQAVRNKWRYRSNKKKIETKVLVKRSNRLDPEDTRFCTKKNPIKALKLWHYTNMGGWGLAAVSR